MNPRWLLLVLSTLLLSACGRDDPVPDASGTEQKSGRKQIPLVTPGPSGSPTPARREALLENPLEKLHLLPDEKIALQVEVLLESQYPNHGDVLLTSIYDTVELRPSFIRLPILLELARRDNGNTGLRTTVLAELQEFLEEDHGESWTDWALALSEHLATREGFLPTDASPED
ncbi:MAG TPA: hypothetical protein DIV39_03655 [Verrucomicrobiales bacterium]|nr:hypothetical protein [Verrucomicrobiales bacterium]|tara:strand:+ start:467 stop:985 length:519 start_codon:yes stop_codon:yes gene_type:complete